MAPSDLSAHTQSAKLQRHRLPPLRLFPGWAWVASLVLHGVLGAGVGWLAYHSLHTKAVDVDVRPPEEMSIVLDLPPVTEGTLLTDLTADPQGVTPAAAGGTTIARVDDGRDGRGGTGRTLTPAVHLSDTAEDARLSPDLLSHLDLNQQQRLRTARDRASWEDRRSTTHPMELTFLASGHGAVAERRAPSESNPSRGARLARRASVAGGAAGAASEDRGEDGQQLLKPGATQLGTRDESPGLGISQAHGGIDHLSSASVASARPDVTLGPVSVPAQAHTRPRDDIDSDQEVATTVRSLVHASTAGGLAGEGSGGSGGGGDPGAGGAEGPGSHPRPLGPGEGDWFELNTTDPRLMAYFREIHAKIDPLWANAFPRSAMIDLKQGTVILEFVISQDGTAKVVWPPVRPSGIDEFDRNCADALRRASPFAPIPRVLGRTNLRVRAPFVAMNPIVK